MKQKITPFFLKAGLAAAVLFLTLNFTTCQSLKAVLQEPVLSLHSVELANINFTGATVLCKVNVENPNAFSIPFPEIAWEFFINTNSFVNGQIKVDQSSIQARGNTIVEVPVSLNYLEVFNTFGSLRGSDQADYKVALAAKFALPILGDKVWKFEHEGTFPLLKAPSINFSGISVQNISLTRVDLEIAWEIENNNSFAMKVNDFSYSLSVNNSQWASGNIPGAPQLEAKRTTRIPLAISISGLAMVRDITEIITRGTDVVYACNGNLNLGADLPGLGNFGNPFNFTGNIKLRR